MRFYCSSVIMFLITIGLYSSELAPYSEFKKNERLKEWELFADNKISERLTYRLDANNSEKNEEKWLISKEYFDESGKLVKFESIDNYNAVSLTSINTYNSENLLLEIEEKDNFRTLVQKQIFSYDPFSKLTKIESIGFNDVVNQIMTFEYLPEKSIVIETTTDSSKSVLVYIVHLYDKSFSKIIKSTNFTKDNEIDGITIFHYIDAGINSRELYTKNIDEPFRIKYQNIYDEKNNLTEVLNLSYPNTLLVTVKNSYYDNNLPKSTSMYDSKGKPITTISYEYTSRQSN